MIYRIILFILIAPVAINAQLELSQNVIENIEARIAAGLNPSIAVGIVSPNGMEYYSFGKTKADGDVVSEHSIYEIGSITKTFTGILLAQLAIEGKVGVDDPANDYLPDDAKLPDYNGMEITLGHLSDHTSSIPRMPTNFEPSDPANPYKDYTVDNMYQFISSLELEREIGSLYEYSNLAQGLLGHILATVEGVSYEQLVKDRICTPLEMQETAITLSGPMLDNLAIGHSSGMEVSNWDIPTLAGAGAIRSSTHDMLRYIAANIGLIETDFADAMGMSHYPRHDLAGGEYVGLGWHIKPHDEGDIVWHNGGTGGYRTFAGFVKEKQLGVVVMTNSTDGVDELGIHLLDNSSYLEEIKPRLAAELKKAIDQNGPEAAMARYKELEGQSDTYDFDESAVNSLGYSYMGVNNTDAALAVFEVNMIAHPESFNVYDSYAEALMEDGQNEEAIKYYKKSIDMNPGNTNGVQMLKKLGVEYEVEAYEVDESILKGYVGTYQLMEGFDIVVSVDGSQIFGQATGQGQFEMFPTSDTEYYLKVTPAEIHFNLSDTGEVESLVTAQAGCFKVDLRGLGRLLVTTSEGGQEMVAKRVR